MAAERIFPAVFHEEEGEFPDIPGCFSRGDTIEEACKMAGEALALDDNHCQAVSNRDIRASGKDSVMLVPADSGDDIVYLKNSAVPGKNR